MPNAVDEKLRLANEWIAYQRGELLKLEAQAKDLESQRHEIYKNFLDSQAAKREAEDLLRRIREFALRPDLEHRMFGSELLAILDGHGASARRLPGETECEWIDRVARDETFQGGVYVSPTDSRRRR